MFPLNTHQDNVSKVPRITFKSADPKKQMDDEGSSSSTSSSDDDERGDEVSSLAWQEALLRRRAAVRSSLFEREISSAPLSSAGREVAVACALSERSLPSHGCDKIFSSVWLDEERLFSGSKDSRLLLWSLSRASSSSSSAQSLSLPPPLGRLPEALGGIHALALSPSRSLLASGSGSPCETAVLAPGRDGEWRPRAVCVGHRDWVFDCDWVDENTLWTAGRDGLIKVWRVATHEWQEEDNDDERTRGERRGKEKVQNDDWCCSGGGGLHSSPPCRSCSRAVGACRGSHGGQSGL